MKTHSLLFSLAALLLVANPVIAAEKDAKKTDHAKHDHVIHELSGLKGADFDNAFLAHMTHHHQSGVDMAQLATKQAESTDLKQMAQKMAAKQTDEIGQMTAMLKAAGKTPADYEMPEENMEKMKQDMAKLKAASGAKFDQVFLTQMIHHHHGALAMTALVPDRSRKQEVKQMAEKMTADQKNEIEKMEKMQD
jgi:uncharacterized protein (DUF305 family)